MMTDEMKNIIKERFKKFTKEPISCGKCGKPLAADRSRPFGKQLYCPFCGFNDIKNKGE